MKSAAIHTANVTHVLEPGVTAFSAAEVHVAVAPVGPVPTEVLESYYTLITKHRQVELQSIQPFYTEHQKSPFKFFPWKQGSMHFRFLPEDMALQQSPLIALHTHRSVLGVIGICHCPLHKSLSGAYARFEAIAKQFPGAMTVRCFAFQPSNEQVADENKDKEKKANLMMFPPTDADGLEQLENHANFLMLDFAAGLLGEMERWMLTASPAMVDLNTFADTSDKFLGPSSMFGDMHKRFPTPTDEEMIRKRRYGRLQKAMGDMSLLAGSPTDAADHYNTAVELARISNDSIWCAAALLGMAHSKVLEECLRCGAIQETVKGDNGEASPNAPNKRIATLKAASQVSTASTGYGGQQFWELLRSSSMEHDVRNFYVEAKSVLPKRGGIPLQVEADLQLARLLAGLHGTRGRREVSDMASSVMEGGVQMLLLEDRLTAMMEAAQILGLVGSARKRTLILWQAVEFSRAHDMALNNTLQIARKALEPPDDPREAEDEPELLAKAKPLGLGVPQHWSSVRCACIEGVLSTAILASKHADVWDAAALLLREHWKDLPYWRQESLLKTLEAAAVQMSEGELQRRGPGPPPLITFKRAVPPPPHLQPRLVSSLNNTPQDEVPDEDTPFIYNPSAAKSKALSKDKAAQTPAQWICGETAAVEVEIWNPTSHPLQVEQVTVEAEHVGDPSVAPRDQDGSHTAWKTFAMPLRVPPNSVITKVLLKGIPLEKGLYTLTGCTATVNKVTWHQPWSPPPPSLASVFRLHPVLQEPGGIAEARVTVAGSLPLLKGRLRAPPTCAASTESLGGVATSSERDPSDTLEPLHVVAFKGQVLRWDLSLRNAGKLKVVHVSVTTEQQPGKFDGGGVRDREYELKTAQSEAAGTTSSTPRARSRSHPITLHLTEDKLLKGLPLGSQASLSLPVMLHPPQVVGYNHEEEAVLDFRIAYHGGRPSNSIPEEEEQPHPPPDGLGRCLTLSAHLRFLPSLQINGVTFFEHHQQPFPPGRTTAEANICHPVLPARRRCVIELDVLNRAPLALQVAAFVDHLLESPEDAEEDSGTARASSTVSRERKLALELCKKLSIYWRREDLHDKSVPVEMGALPLPVDLVEGALSPQVVDALEPAIIKMTFAARMSPPASAETSLDDADLADVEEEQLVGPGQEAGDGSQHKGAVWGFKAALGQAVQLSLQVANKNPEEQDVEASIACHSTEVGKDMQRGVEDPNVLACGTLTGVPLTVASKASQSHFFAVCFLLPGLYQVYTYDVSLRTTKLKPTAKGPRHSCRAGYILVV